MRCRAAFFDIDGTIVSFRTHVIPDAVHDTLMRLHEMGIRIAVVSGRPCDYIDNLGDIPFDAVVGCNGAMAFADGKLVYSHPIERRQAVRLAEIATENRIPTFTFSLHDSFINCMNSRSQGILDMLHLGLPPQGDIVRFAEENDIFEFTTYVTPSEEAEFYHERVEDVSYIRWHNDFTDVNPAGVDKAVALEELCRYWGIDPADTMAFGDGGNDIPMLRRAGIGVAMGSALEDVRAAADWCTEGVDEDGVTVALRHFGVL